MIETYIYGTRINTPDYIVRGTDKYRVISDERGSVRLVVKVSDGTVAQEIAYDEFGNVVTDTNPGFQPFYYAGGVYDLDTKLVKFGARDYDPETGRWLQKEPLGFAGAMNFYTYAKNDPINWIDITGREPEKCYYNYNEALIAAGDAVLEQPGHFYHEYASTVYMTEDEYGKACYMHTAATTSYDPKHVDPPWYPIDTDPQAIVHNHPEDEYFGEDDYKAAAAGLDVYKVDDNGQLEKLEL